MGGSRRKGRSLCVLLLASGGGTWFLWRRLENGRIDFLQRYSRYRPTVAPARGCADSTSFGPVRARARPIQTASTNKHGGSPGGDSPPWERGIGSSEESRVSSSCCGGGARRRSGPGRGRPSSRAPAPGRRWRSHPGLLEVDLDVLLRSTLVIDWSKLAMMLEPVLALLAEVEGLRVRSAADQLVHIERHLAVSHSVEVDDERLEGQALVGRRDRRGSRTCRRSSSHELGRCPSRR